MDKKIIKLILGSLKNKQQLDTLKEKSKRAIKTK
jgi:hypothetical protein